MNATEREEFYLELIALVAKLQRNNGRGVYPYMIVAHLDFIRREQTLRKDMRKLAERGDLIRVESYKSRKGYIIPPQAAKRQVIGMPTSQSLPLAA
jgi:hypothetical protein